MLFVSKSLNSEGAGISSYAYTPTLPPQGLFYCSLTSTTRVGEPGKLYFFPVDGGEYVFDKIDVSFSPLTMVVHVYLNTPTSSTDLGFKMKVYPQSSIFRDYDSYGDGYLALYGLVSGSSTSFKGFLYYSIDIGGRNNNSFFSPGGGSAGPFGSYLFHLIIYGFPVSRDDIYLQTPSGSDLSLSVTSMLLELTFMVFE